MSKEINTKNLSELKDNYLSGEIDKRTFLRFLGVAGVAAGVLNPTFLSWARASTVEELKYHGWGGVVQEAVRRTAIEPFQNSTGISVLESSSGLEEEMLTSARAGQPGDYHIINSAGISWYKRWIDAGFGVVLNETNIPNMGNVIPALVDPFRKVTPDGLSAVPMSYGNTGIAYNRKYISDESAAELRENLLLQDDLKNKISGHNDFQTRVWIGALQAGQNPNQIDDIEAVWEHVRKNRSLVKKYWGSGQESMDLLASEEVYAADIWSGRAAALMARKEEIGYVELSVPRCWLFDLLVVKGAPVEVCEQFLNFFLEPEVATAVAEAQLYPPPLDPAKFEFSETIRALPNFDPSGSLAMYAFDDPFYWTANERTWRQMYDRISRGF